MKYTTTKPRRGVAGVLLCRCHPGCRWPRGQCPMRGTPTVGTRPDGQLFTMERDGVLVEHTCPACGYVACDCARREQVKQEESKPQADGWTEHETCAGGWNDCHHYAGSALHVLVQGDDEYCVSVTAVDNDDGESLFDGTLEQCKRWVERFEREKAAVVAQDAVPEGWRRYESTGESRREIQHVATGVRVYHGSMFSTRWYHNLMRDYDGHPTRAEAMAAALSYRIEHATDARAYYWAHSNPPSGISASRGYFDTREAAALAALAFDAAQRRASKADAKAVEWSKPDIMCDSTMRSDRRACVWTPNRGGWWFAGKLASGAVWDAVPWGLVKHTTIAAAMRFADEQLAIEDAKGRA